MGSVSQPPRPSAAAWYPLMLRWPCLATVRCRKKLFPASKVFYWLWCQPWSSIELINYLTMENTICILVQKYNSDPVNYVFCEVIKGAPRNFRLHKNYIKAFSNPLQIGKAYIVKHSEVPSDCGQFTNVSISVLSELSEDAKVKILLGD